MYKKKLLSMLLAVFLSIAFNITAFAGSSVQNKQDEKEQHQDQVKQLKGDISDINDQIADGEKEYAELNASIKSINAYIYNTQTKINGVQKKISVATDELNAAIAEYKKQDEAMKKRINTLYKNGTTISYLQILLESKSLSDFLTNADILKRIINYDMDMLQEMKAKREAIDKKKADLEQDKAELVALKKGLDEKSSELKTKESRQSSLLAQLNKQKSEKQKKLNREEAAIEKADKEIKELLAEIARQNAEKAKNGDTSANVNYDGSKYAILHLSDFPAGHRPYISSTFYENRGGKIHGALDISTNHVVNIPVYSMAPGTVVLVRYDPDGYGNYVVIDHGGGISTLYAHNNKILVSVGQNVAGGQKISLSGNTGSSTGPHVHFEVRINGNRVNPAPYYMLGN